MAGSTRARDSRRSSSSMGSYSTRAAADASGARDLARTGDGQRGSAEARKPRWQARLTLGQVVVMWSVIAGTMVMVFLFGLYAGREQGLRRAFEEYGGEAVRLAVANPIPQAVPATVGPATVAGGAVAPTVGAPLPASPTARTEVARAAADGNGRAALAAPSVAPQAGASTGAQGSSKLGGAAQPELAAEVDRGQTAQILALETGAKPGSAKAAEPEIDFAAPTSGLPSVGGLTAKPTIQLFKDDAIASEAAAAKVGQERPAPGTIGALAKSDLVIDRVTDPKPSALKPSNAGAGSSASLERAAVEKLESEKTKGIEQGKGKWFVQVAAARTRAEANAMNKKLAQAKLKGKIEEAKVGRNTYYRVVVGPYSSKEAASAARAPVKRARAAAGDPFVRQAQ